MVVGQRRPRELLLIAAAAVAALLVYRGAPRPPTSSTASERGRQVYISEGCISCHSQYVRPNSPDVLMWGPTETLQEIHAQKPPLIGNRRQGPDLSEVGLRRSPLWLKAHLVDPGEVSYRSPMPSYAFLFRDSRGEDLVAYLENLRGPGEQQQLQREASWSPAPSAASAATLAEGQTLYQQHCATCHDSQGATRLRWSGAWRKDPQTLSEMRAFAVHQPAAKLAQTAKFGITGTDMPGHEYLSDKQIASLVLWLKLAPSQNDSQPSNHGQEDSNE